MEQKPIKLQVGERHFQTTPETLLNGSDYFASLLSGRWDVNTATATEDRSYFIDFNGDVFAHILDYLRDGIFPLFYELHSGHNHALYAKLLVQARYFQIEPLVTWLQDEKYLKVVKREHEILEAEGIESLRMILRNWSHADKIKYFPQRVKEMVYVCPRSISVHRGNPKKCGAACIRARGEAEDIYEEEEVLNIVAVKMETIVDRRLLMGEKA